MVPRRYLISIDTFRVPHRFTDVVVIGGGVAGLRAAIAAAETGTTQVTVLAKASVWESSTAYAQGGVAAVLAPEETHDSVDNHVTDTMNAGCGLSNPAVVEIVVKEGVERIQELIRWGAQFDGAGGRYHFTREGGHSFPRILHAQGDATGREVERTLLEKVRTMAQILLIEDCFVIDLLTEDGRCAGAIVCEDHRGPMVIWARKTILATGGCGRLFRETTNPSPITGDGTAMAFRAGATVMNTEFVQFHPTTLYLAGTERFLITEAVRGEGAVLRDRHGKAFLSDYDPRAELAPRDVVSRAILRQMAKVNDSKVYLDLTHLNPNRVRERFPGVARICNSFGIDISKDPIPVRPSAHYFVGGIRVGLRGETDVPDLFACGEVTATGLHGANRLGSNSLLEGLVYGKRAGEQAATEAMDCPPAFRPHRRIIGESSGQWSVDILDLTNSLRSLMGRCAGIERTDDGLQEAAEQIDRWMRFALHVDFTRPEGWSLQNMLLVAFLIVEGARERTESRGVHYRADYPERDDDRWARDSTRSVRDYGGLGNG